MPEIKAVGKHPIFNADVMFALFMGGILFVLLLRLPTSLLSVLIVFNIAIAIMLLLMIFYLKTPLEISSFPSLLLVLTLYRLALNVAATKLILLEGNAGSVIDAFGKFVVGNNYIVGAVVFTILYIIQFIVIVKGSSRIAEVSARFTLDAMPGKQMSIDSDLNAGLIDEPEAKARRKALSDEAEFYGSMDGASKFVTGDAVAGVVITVVNIIGGLALGIFQRGMPAAEALQTYTILTIGDGLVSQIPALLISLSAGMLVAKTASEDGGTGAHLVKQIFRRHQPLFLCSFMLAVLSVMPGFPFFPFATLAAGSFFAGMVLYRRNQTALAAGIDPFAPPGAGGATIGALQSSEGGKALPGGPGETPAAPALDTTLPKVNPMTLELGFSLVPLVDPNHDGDLVARISQIRKQIKDEMGFLIPPISIQDNIELGNNEYRIMVRGLERARGSVYPSSHLAINPGDAHGNLDGVRTKDPAFGFDAVWIPKEKVDAAESIGYTVVDAASVITTHVTKIVKDYAAELLSRQDVSNMIEQVKERNEAVVSELSTNQLSTGVIHRVLQHLLDEKVPVHDLPRILEVLSDYAPQTKDAVILCEFARQALKGHIVSRHVGDDRTMYAITLDPALEEEIQSSISHGSGGGIMSLSPERASEITDAIKHRFTEVGQMTDHEVVLLVSPLIRLHLFRLLDRKMEHISVLSYSEVSDDVPLKVLATVKVSGKGSIAA